MRGFRADVARWRRVGNCGDGGESDGDGDESAGESDDDGNGDGNGDGDDDDAGDEALGVEEALAVFHASQ